ncbi:Plasminogen activator inhibitor 2 type A [Lemmus lemmus]
MEELSMANTVFALNIFKHIEQTNSAQNIFFSPWSISSTLAMVFLGARGNTEHQMAKAQARDKVHSSFKSLSSAINTCSGDYLLESANKLFGEKSARFKEEYIQLCKKYYSTEPEAVDFLKYAEEARKKINSWVKTQTKGEIPNLLPEGSVDEDTKMVLVNAVYFKGKWKTPFAKKLNELYPFRLNLSESKPVQMMYLREKLNIGYIMELKTQILELPYIGDISMLLLLPDEIEDASTGLELLERAITYEKLHEWTSADMLDTFEVQLYLPKFKLEESYDLKSALSSMGMTDAFSQSKADFSNMSPDRNLFLSNVFHKTFVEINEEGTEAAAGTGSEVSLRIKKPSIEFNADHPFLFFIRHNKTNSILFYGRFCSP